MCSKGCKRTVLVVSMQSRSPTVQHVRKIVLVLESQQLAELLGPPEWGAWQQLAVSGIFHVPKGLTLAREFKTQQCCLELFPKAPVVHGPLPGERPRRGPA